METVWNKDSNVASTLFPNSQSLIMEGMDEDELMSMALAESIVTAQIEQFRLDDEKMNKADGPQDESEDEWGNSQCNLPDSPKPDNDVGNQVSMKQCHDNNNNNAKSEAQSASDIRKGVQKPTIKVNTKRISDQKAKRPPGNILRVTCSTPKQGSKEKDDSVNLSKEDNANSAPATDSKSLPVAASPKSTDKYGKVEGYNTRHTFMGKGGRIKDQQCAKQQSSSFNDVSNKSKTSASEGLAERGKTFIASTKLKSSRMESEKKSNDADDTKKCHRVQVTRTQSYNVQYNRSKSVLKSQPRYSRNSTKLEQETPTKQHTSENVSAPSTSADDGLKKSYENGQAVGEKQVSDVQHSQTTSGKEYTGSEKSSTRPMGFTSYKTTSRSSFSAKTNIEKSTKDDQSYTPKFRVDSNVFKRSTDYTEPKYSNARTRNDEQMKSTDNNSTKDYRISRTMSVDAKSGIQPVNARTTVNPTKTIIGANKTNKTDISSTINNIQPAKLLNSCSNSTKVPTTSTNATTQARKEPEISQTSYSGNEVQSTVKTEQEENSNNTSNKTSTSISETKSVKFSDNVQEINATVAHSPMSYPNNSVQPGKLASTNPFYSDLQNPYQANNAQQDESHQNIQSKNYFENASQDNNALLTSIHSPDRDLQLSDVQQQKTEPVHIFPQGVAQQNTSNLPITAGNGMQYQNMYLNQYNGVQTLPRKTANTTNVSQNSMITGTPPYNMENQNIMQTDTSNILMQNNQTTVLPPPGFHSHPMSTQHNQWNVPLSDVFYFGNMMNAAAATSTHPLNMQIPNSRPLCGTEYNNIQQAGYMQSPVFYMPPLCVQGWNQMLQYPAPLYQSPQYVNCGTYPNQVMPPNNVSEPINCPATTAAQSNPYKQQQYQLQQFETNPGNYSAPLKVDNYMSNVQNYKTNHPRMNAMDGQARANQYRVPVPNEYQNYAQDAQLGTPCSYPAAMDSSRNVQSNVHIRTNQKYHSRYVQYTATYDRMLESALQNCQESHRKDDVAKTDSECIPPMVSPRECMYYGVNYSRKTDNIPNSNVRSDIKHMPYNMHSGNLQHSVPQFHNNSAYHGPSRDMQSRANLGHGLRKMTDQ